jgi:uncharacterized protein (DUF433 family)
MVQAYPLLGVGLYTPSEAALYARVPARMLRRWFYGTKERRAALRPQFSGEDKTITFLDFVQTLAVREIRLRHGVPLQRIRQAVEVARKVGVEYPFARPHKTFLFGQDIAIQLDDGRLVQASGKHKTNTLMKRIVELYLRDLTFGPNGLAASYLAFKWNACEITMDPKVRFGEPMIRSSGYSARALWEAVESEGGIKEAAEAYGVEEAEVEAAYRYYDYLDRLDDSAA